MSFFGFPMFLKIIAKQDKNDLNWIYLLFLSALIEVTKPGFYLAKMIMLVNCMMMMINEDDDDQDDQEIKAIKISMIRM